MTKDYYHEVRNSIDAIEREATILLTQVEGAKRSAIGSDMTDYRAVVNKENAKRLKKLEEDLVRARKKVMKPKRLRA